MKNQPDPQPQPRTFLELDLMAWNLPAPRPEPVGPVREVWPVRPLPTRGVEQQNLFEDPAAA